MGEEKGALLGYLEQRVESVSGLVKNALRASEARERELEARVCRYAEEAMYYKNRWEELQQALTESKERG